MDLIIDGIKQAFLLLIHGDPKVIQVVWLSLAVSGSATILSLCIGIPLGSILGLARFPGRRFIISLINTGMGAPPVVVGLAVTIFLWRNGPLGVLHLLYTPSAMVLAQFVIALPLVAGFTLATIQQQDPKLRLQILSLGASRFQMVWLLLKEARLPLLAAVMAGFGAVISEVGASMMVGGNITGQTQVMTTAIVGETSKGEFAVAIAFSIILMVLVYLVNLILTTIQQRSRAG
ncbi:MAG: ABC transporter permease [Dehalococcoidales bacterium]|jgi:tungstate transport system permease protein|nr:ABC transporter permease [Dehalococcoidales bacterium]